MRARLVTASIWISVTFAVAGGCRLDPVSNPPTLSPDPDASAPGLDAGAAERPATPPDVRLDRAGSEAGSEGDRPRDTAGANPPDAGPDVSADRPPPPIDLATDVTPDGPIIDPLTVGLVAHWQFNEGSGTESADVTGNGHTATLFNGIAWERTSVPGRPVTDFAIRLDGSDDYAACVAGATMPAIEASKTISFWFVANPDAPPPLGSNRRTCVALVNPGATVGVQVGLDGTRPAAWSWAQVASLVIADTEPAAGVQRVTYTFDGNSHRLYLDGTLVDTSTALPQQGRVSALYIGTYEFPNELCAGQIDDLRVYNRALPIEEVTRLAARP